MQRESLEKSRRSFDSIVYCESHKSRVEEYGYKWLHIEYIKVYKGI